MRGEPDKQDCPGGNIPELYDQASLSKLLEIILDSQADEFMHKYVEQFKSPMLLINNHF